jgi:hypothetical protein
MTDKTRCVKQLNQSLIILDMRLDMRDLEEQVVTSLKQLEVQVEESYGSPLHKHSKWITQLFKRMENGAESTRLTKRDQEVELEDPFKS